MPNTNLPTDLLRTFITIIELGGFTRAADVLARSQPAVSLQMKRLETLLGSKLIVQTGRELTLTDDGRALAVIARQMLRLNDMAVGQFERRRPEETVRIGLPVDYAVSVMQEGMTSFLRTDEHALIEIQCDLSRNLLERLHRDEIDIVLALFSEPDQQYLFKSWHERPLWVAAKNWRADPAGAVPIIAHPDGCEYRIRMTTALARSRRNWRVIFSSPGIQAVQQAVLDGLGASCMTGPTFLDGMRELTPDEGFPELEDLNIGLFYKHARLRESGHRAVGFLSDIVAQATGADPA